MGMHTLGEAHGRGHDRDSHCSDRFLLGDGRRDLIHGSTQGPMIAHGADDVAAVMPRGGGCRGERVSFMGLAGAGRLAGALAVALAVSSKRRDGAGQAHESEDGQEGSEEFHASFLGAGKSSVISHQ
jgi:hypothetical protein